MHGRGMKGVDGLIDGRGWIAGWMTDGWMGGQTYEADPHGS